jgi:hypothetical protein
MSVDEVYLVQQQRNESALRIELELQRQPHYFIFKIFMQQVDRANTNTEEKYCLRKFEQPNRQQTSVMRTTGVAPMFLFIH